MKKIIILALSLLVSACQEAPAAYQPAPFAFEAASNAPIAINVARIELINHYQSPLRRPNVEQEFPVSPAQAVQKWVGSRLKATGTSGVLEVTINEASAKETPLAKTKGVKGLFTDDQDARYDAKIAVSMRLLVPAQNVSSASADVEITRSHSINEKATVYEREAMYHQMAQAMMADFDREAQARLHQYFAGYVR